MKHHFDIQLSSGRMVSEPWTRFGSQNGRDLSPHLWDGTFFWGMDVYSSYEKWFVKTITYAADNRNLNWVINVHPANRTKDTRDGYRGTHNEIRIIQQMVAEVPAHIHILPGESPVSTFSLFSLADYCLTVCGTVGMEAACFGVSVVTAGTVRYDRKGFTVAVQSSSEHRALITRLHELEPLSKHQVELPLEAMNTSYCS